METLRSRACVRGLGVVTPSSHVDSFWSSFWPAKCGIIVVKLFDPKEYALPAIGRGARLGAAQHMDPKSRRNDRYTHLVSIAPRQGSTTPLTCERDNDRVAYQSAGHRRMYTFESQLKVLGERGPRKVSPLRFPR